MQSFILSIVVFATLVSAAYVEDNEIEHDEPYGLGRGYVLQRCGSCGPNRCRVMGMQRYSEPRCEQFGGLGAACRMWQEPENKTLHFPNKILECSDVYMQYCPCADGLTCHEMECKYLQNDESLEDAGDIETPEEEGEEDAVLDRYRWSLFEGEAAQ